MTKPTLPDLQPLIDELVAQGADVVWLAGSQARGDAGPHSDIDVGVLADDRLRRPRAFRVYGGALTSIVWTTADATRASFRDPAQVGGAVPGWRGPVLLHDPKSIGAKLVDEARAWTWAALEPACDRWVAAQITQLAEEVHKLLNALAANHDANAAIRRNVLAQGLPLVMSVHRRILYDSETQLWDVVADAMAVEWRQCQAKALMLGGESWLDSATAALQLYRIAANESSGILSGEQGDVAAHTLGLSSR